MLTASRTRGFGGILDTVTDPSNLASLIDSIEIRTAFTPPVTYTGAELVADAPAGGSPGTMGALLKPTIIVKSKLGTKTLAPSGVTGPDDWRGNVNMLALGVGLGAVVLIGAGFALARATGR